MLFCCVTLVGYGSSIEAYPFVNACSLSNTPIQKPNAQLITTSSKTRLPF